MKALLVKDHTLTMADDVTPPKPQAGEVTVKIKCASVNPTDLELAAGIYDKLLADTGKLGVTRTGLEFAGVVTSNGKHFSKGDEVFGYIDLLAGDKTHQEEIAVNEEFMTNKPASISFTESAAFPLGALTTLVALRDVAKAKPGERLLINGASGGLGVYATQIAAQRLGLHVTTVAGPNQNGLLQGLGAHKVIDYTQENILQSNEQFDIIFDLTTKMQFADIDPLLSPKGRFMPAEPLKSGVDYSEGAYSGSRSVNLWVQHGDREILTQIADWVNAGELKIFVDSVFNFEDFQQAFNRLKEPDKRGRIIMSLDNNVG